MHLSLQLKRRVSCRLMNVLVLVLKWGGFHRIRFLFSTGVFFTFHQSEELKWVWYLICIIPKRMRKFSVAGSSSGVYWVYHNNVVLSCIIDPRLQRTSKYILLSWTGENNLIRIALLLRGNKQYRQWKVEPLNEAYRKTARQNFSVPDSTSKPINQCSPLQ